jgi:hypothetical protein
MAVFIGAIVTLEIIVAVPIMLYISVEAVVSKVKEPPDAVIVIVSCTFKKGILYFFK